MLVFIYSYVGGRQNQHASPVSRCWLNGGTNEYNIAYHCRRRRCWLMRQGKEMKAGSTGVDASNCRRRR